MSTPQLHSNPHHAALITLLSCHGIQGSRVERAVDWELRAWTPEETELLLAQLRPLEKIKGNKEPCGPRFNVYSPLTPWMAVVLYTLTGAGTVCLIPLQVGAGVYLAWWSQWRAIWQELPRATIEFAEWNGNTFKFIKAAPDLVQRGLKERKALCVNRHGTLRLLARGYSIMSHVWGETQGWQSTTGWGAVTLELRRRGMPLDHLKRCIDVCGAEWLWLDSVAMPAVLEDMDEKSAAAVEHTRVDIINQLRYIYTRADKVVVVDSALVRLSSAGMVDAAAVLSVGFWMHRLWPMVECRLGSKVVLKTQDQFFDLDTLIDYLARTVNNDSHRYFSLLHRLTPLRSTPDWSERLVYHSDRRESSLLQDAYFAGEGRHTNVNVDEIRVLFPLLGLDWGYNWTLEDGVSCIAEKLPEERGMLMKWCEYRRIPLPNK